ncbi:MAG: DNA translocase FtsK [Bacteroidaceae bacterium]|nr:DNA translocase FtsK [Bacteroidaceae bacterium]
MSTNSKDKKSRTGRQKPQFRFNLSEIVQGFRSDTFVFSTGAAFVVIALFVIIAYFSFLFNGGADQSFLAAGQEAAAEAGQVANSMGTLGARASETFVNGWFGLSSILLPVLLLAIGLRMMSIAHFKIVGWCISCIFLTVWLSLFLQLVLGGIMGKSFIIPGGMHGRNLLEFLKIHIGVPGVVLLLAFTMLIFCISVTRNTIGWIRGKADGLKSGLHGIEDGLSSISKKVSGAFEGVEQDEFDDDDDDSNISDSAIQVSDSANERPVQDIDTPEPYGSETKVPQDDTAPAIGPVSATGPAEDIQDNPSEDPLAGVNDLGSQTGTPDEKPEGLLQEPYDPRLDLSHYKFPTLNLLKHYDNSSPAIDEAEQQANKERIITVLRNFGIEIDTIQATVGPTITLYEITPAAGVRISKICNLEADIALSLSALGIRIIAPMPGKGTIGIEVPNARPVMVSMESILNTKKFAEAEQKMELPMALGRTITNEVYIQDLAAMPHLLVAGATGMGKSVGLNCIITSLLYKKHPAELKLVMVDPKMVEFSIYAPIIKHFLAKLPDEDEAIITDTTKVIHTLKSLCIEMDNRYELLKQASVRSIREYNEKFKSRQLNPNLGHRFLPYIVVIIDEFGDLIMTAGKDIEMPIARIAQKARAVGMHMIIATQRPTTNIITGTIKANFPARMAFRVSSMIDSRTILDRPGANQLIGRGDMLFLGKGEPERVQCAFVDTPEVNAVCEYISRQQGYTDAYPLPEYVDENEGGIPDSGMEMGKFDSLFAEAARLVVVNQLGSTSLIQRKFSIGYNRAGRLMDQLEKTGIVGRQDGSKPRPVLVTDETQLDRILETYNLL